MQKCELCDQDMIFVASINRKGFQMRKFYRCPNCEFRLIVPPLATVKVLDPVAAYIASDLAHAE